VKNSRFIQAHGALLDLESPKIMGVLNATPDSFFSGNRSVQQKRQRELLDQMIQDGADIIDIGGMSSRPGAEIISSRDEVERISPIVDYCIEHYPQTWLSIDTIHGDTARVMLEKGVHLINDISGGQYDPGIVDIVSEYKVPYVCMHMKGVPKTMVHQNKYQDLIRELMLFFKERIQTLSSKGIKDIIIDPGFGFSKNIAQNYQLLHHLHKFKIFDFPLLVGVSRKSMIYKVLNTDPENALNGTTVIHTLALLQGAEILRVHDIKEAKETMQLLAYYQQINAESET